MFQLFALLAAVTSLAQAQVCPPVLPAPQLCGTPNVVVDLTTCGNTTVNFGDMPPCCRLHQEPQQKCVDPTQPACRSMEVLPALCPGLGEGDCCFEKRMSMKLYLNFEFSNTTCCSSCRCYGDPHCESFNGVPDTWVLCDGRHPKPGNIAQCPISKDMCLSQLDHTGNPCKWTPTTAALPKDWLIAAQGSPCRPSEDPVAQMTMYSFDGFSIVLNMGERAIISDVIITDQANTYVLGAEDCFDYAFSNRSVTPWKDINGQVPAQDDWLPKKWLWGPAGADVVWEATGLTTSIDLTVRCTRTPYRQAGKIRYGPPRLNVDFVEPFNWKDLDQRPNSAGFCPEDKITKLGTTSNTDSIVAMGACDEIVGGLATAQALCGSAVTTPGIPNCQLNWCRDNLPITSTSEQQTDCVNDIQTFGWPAQFCALNVFGSRRCNGDPLCLRTGKDCAGDLDCRKCVSYISDNGWAAAILTYSASVGPSEDECKDRSEMPEDLLGNCEEGVRIQYQIGNVWITKFAVPSTTCAKGGFLTINKETDPELFRYPFRILQCSSPAGTCLSNKCTSQVGFSARVEMEVFPNEFEIVWNLFENGDLVCNPDRWSTPTECLGYTPPALCPCP